MTAWIECDHEWEPFWDGSLGYSATDKCWRCNEYRPAQTAPKTSPAMGPEQQVEEVSSDDSRLGLVAEGNQSEGRQVLGTCSPELITRLQTIRDTCITSVEKRAVQDCIDAVRAEQVGPYMAGYLRAMAAIREVSVVVDNAEIWVVTVQLPREVWNELQEVR